jgi:3',5'-cyclic AMP phosphodiesterase CpdA
MKHFWVKSLCILSLLGMLAAGVVWAGESFTFVQLSDPQLGMGGYERDVRTFELAVKQINASSPDFVIICGDLTEAIDPAQIDDFNRIKAGFNMPCYCAPGNHDLSNNPDSATLELYRLRIGPDWQSFEHKGITFAIVNTQLWKANVPEESSRQEQWLDGVLDRAVEKGSPVVIAGHYPLFDQYPNENEGYFNLPLETRKTLLKKFHESGVVAVLSGHAHKNNIQSVSDIQFVTNASTSRNFDGAPMGYRVWKVEGNSPWKHEYVPVEGAEPLKD